MGGGRHDPSGGTAPMNRTDCRTVVSTAGWSGSTSRSPGARRPRRAPVIDDPGIQVPGRVRRFGLRLELGEEAGLAADRGLGGPRASRGPPSIRIGSAEIDSKPTFWVKWRPAGRSSARCLAALCPAQGSMSPWGSFQARRLDPLVRGPHPHGVPWPGGGIPAVWNLRGTPGRRHRRRRGHRGRRRATAPTSERGRQSGPGTPP